MTVFYICSYTELVTLILGVNLKIVLIVWICVVDVSEASMFRVCNFLVHWFSDIEL